MPQCKFKNRAALKVVLFCLLALLGTATCFLKVYDCLQRYQAKLTGTSDLYKHTSEVPFPDLTFCPVFGYKEDILQNNGIKNVTDYTKSNWISNEPFKGPENFYQEVTYTLEEMIEQVEVHFDGEVNGHEKVIFSPKGGNPCGGSTRVFLAREYYFNGNCYSVVMPQCLHQAGPLEVNYS